MRARSGLSRSLSWVLLVPFLLLALLPGGVMPRLSPQGVVLVLCTGDGLQELRIDPQTGLPLDEGEAEDRHCPWAQLRLTDALAVSPVLPLPLVTGAQDLEPARPMLRVIAAATGLPPATGPPLSV